eukprot:SAG22_NODE_3533_length_1657_cov_1.340180_1_plen_433_part_10
MQAAAGWLEDPSGLAFVTTCGSNGGQQQRCTLSRIFSHHVGPEAPCTFLPGDGSGGSEARVGAAGSPAECEQLVRTSQPAANGATYGPGITGTNCYAEFGMTGSTASLISWHTCQFGVEGSLHLPAIHQTSSGTVMSIVVVRAEDGRIPGATWSVWNHIGGSSVSDLLSDLRFPDSPDSVALLTDSFEVPINMQEFVGQSVSCYFRAPADGLYVFMIASDDSSTLQMGNGPTSELQTIAYVNGYTGSRQWSKYPSQASAPIELIDGSFYYLRALAKEASGDDNLAVGVRLPSGQELKPIPVEGFLSTQPIQNTDFALVYSSSLQTCDDTDLAWGRLGLSPEEWKLHALSLDECQTLCLAHPGCKYIFHQPQRGAGQQTCHLHEQCDVQRTAAFAGNTWVLLAEPVSSGSDLLVSIDVVNGTIVFGGRAEYTGV